MTEDHRATLESRIAVLESRHGTLAEVVDEIRDDVKKLTAWQRYMLGAGAMVGALVATFYRDIADWFKS